MHCTGYHWWLLSSLNEFGIADLPLPAAKQDFILTSHHLCSVTCISLTSLYRYHTVALPCILVMTLGFPSHSGTGWLLSWTPWQTKRCGKGSAEARHDFDREEGCGCGSAQGVSADPSSTDPSREFGKASHGYWQQGLADFCCQWIEGFQLPGLQNPVDLSCSRFALLPCLHCSDRHQACGSLPSKWIRKENC